MNYHVHASLPVVLMVLGGGTGWGVEKPNAAAVPPRQDAPYIGVSYYPEVAGELLEEDIRHMHEIGINMVRFGDFAWSEIEPREGQYDFKVLRRAVNKFAEAKIPVVLCTPTAAPPAWLSTAHPEILRVNTTGQRVGHGGRRHYCPNSPLYREYSRRIAEQLGKAFGKHPGVVAWQIDNEFWQECYCDNCLARFHDWLKEQYGTIENLNELWLTTLWSQTYPSFEQIPLPNPTNVGGRHHPSLRLAYRRFMSDSYVSYCMEQARELRRHTAARITTNAHNPLYQRIDYTELFRGLDIVCTDSYAGPDNLLRYAFEADWMRALGHKVFWLAETSSSWAAATTAGGATEFAHAPGALRAKMWLNYALGAEAVSFWLWRAHWAGQELEHGSLLYHWGDEAANTPEIRQVAHEIAQHEAWLMSTKPVPATAAMHYGVPEQWQFEATGIADGFKYDSDIAAFHRMLARAGISRDVIAPGAPVNAYQVVFSPYAPYLPPNVIEQMKEFVAAGGIWVLGPLSACRTADATAHSDAAYGAEFEGWLGVHVRHRLPAHPSIRIKTKDETLECKWWCDAYQPNPDCKILARYSGGAPDGLAAAVERSIGRGKVILLGTQPPDAWWQPLLREVAGPNRHDPTPGVVLCERAGSDGRPAGVIAINTDATAGSFVWDGAKRKLPGFGVQLLPSPTGR